MELGALLPALLGLLPAPEEFAHLHPPGPAAPSVPRRAAVDVRVSRDGTGTFGLLLEDTTALVVRLDPHGAAALAGLRRGDRVLCVDGAPLVGGTGGGIARAVLASPNSNLFLTPYPLNPTLSPIYNPNPNPNPQPQP